ncbi:hypothetical protein [Desulfosporosinus hippei]|uniref:Uncharacterized protein n=1 Tax=Desulfosporosinus hippei DSM 8344 TaxID=1121419 RepID=A0A1G7ZTR3_9FIRM|nr:hypothetical protein [Desulfosporosinus hippei]SDH12054.1 hypothetical protein SAMN05443529_1103 [Desulfosporosinus hippei DSM 8344]
MKKIPNDDEIYQTFLSFLNFSFDLINKIDSTNDYLKFAVVNIQISLELFLKYYFMKKGQKDLIIVKKNGQEKEFKDFSDILNLFFTQNRWSYGSKKELRKILDARNYIVHSGLKAGWNYELAKYLIKCILFMQGTMQSSFDSNSIKIQLQEFHISKNKIWKEGVEEFVKLKGYYALTCPECDTRSFVSCENFRFIDFFDEDLKHCLCCFTYIDSDMAKFIDCYNCGEASYMIEPLNKQDNDFYVGICLECNTNTWVKKCNHCGKFYHPSVVSGYSYKGKSYCCKKCASWHF